LELPTVTPATTLDPETIVRRLATGEMCRDVMGQRMPTRLSTPTMRRRFDHAIELGYLVGSRSDHALRNLWAARADLLGVADALVLTTPKRATVRLDLLPAAVKLDEEQLTRIRAAVLFDRGALITPGYVSVRCRVGVEAIETARLLVREAREAVRVI
jgi:hypothetical protein